MTAAPTAASTILQPSRRTLAETYDVALLDLDGVVYVGSAAVPGVPRALGRARDRGMRLAFVTNNAARTPEAVAAHLTELGVPAQPAEVTTSSQAAAHYLADRLSPGAAVLVIGTTGLIEALRERGLTPVQSADDHPQAVVQGYSPDLDWRQLAEGAVAIRRGVQWIATNLDPTVPSARGPLPGNGSLVAALRHATGVTPVATGKPDPTMHRESVERSGAQRPIVVGDRLDTDIEGARRVGCASVLVLSGVTSPADLLAAPADSRPDYLGLDASALLIAHPQPVVADTGGVRQVSCNGWTVRLADDGDHTVVLARAVGPDTTLDGTPDTTPDGTPDTTPDASPDGLDPLRAACELVWSLASDEPARWSVRCADEESAAAWRRCDPTGSAVEDDAAEGAAEGS